MKKNNNKKKQTTENLQNTIKMLKLSNKNKNKNKPKKKNKNKKTNSMIDPVSFISTAPVSIGNTIKGSKPTTRSVAGGVQVIGRDYAFTPLSSGNVGTWVLVGGMPLTPCCMPSTILRNFVQMYNQFKINKLVFHYITSTPTSSNGDIMFYSSKQTLSQLPKCTNNNFLPFVLSDPNTILGVQWSNHSISVIPTEKWLDTDYGSIPSDPNLYTNGDVFLYSKTTSTSSPGYVLIDYDITFKELSIDPRVGTFPYSRISYNPVNISLTGAQVAGVGDITAVSSGTAFIGGTTITAFSTIPVSGDIYALILDITNSSFSATDATNVVNDVVGGSSFPTTLVDGEIIYLYFKYATQSFLYATLNNAVSATSALRYGATGTYNEVIRGYAKYITTVNLETIKSSY